MHPPMKTNIAFRRSLFPQSRQTRHLAALALLLPGLLALSPSSSQGAAATPEGATFTTATCTYIGGVKRWVYRVDPPEVQAFRLTVTYDPLRAQFNNVAGVLFKQPFTGAVDSTVAGILVVAGSTPVGQTQPNDVDIFEIIFDDLNPLLPINNVTFTVGGGAGDFIQAYDAGVPLPPITGAALGPLSRSVTPGILPMSFDPSGGYDNGSIGGPGVWDASTAIFDALPLPAVLNAGQNPALVAWTNGTNLAVFGGNQGTGLVTVSSGISAGGLQFDSPGYQLSGGTLTLATPVGSIPTIEVRAGEVAINTPIGGTQGVKKTGKGMVVLGGMNSFTGPTTIAAGAVQISADANLGAAPSVPAAGMLVLDGGVLRVTSAMTLNANRGMTITAANGTVDVATGGNLHYAGVIAGSGNLTKVGAGTLKLSGNNTFTGGTAVFAGVLVNTGSLVGGVTVFSGARLSGGGSISGPVTIDSGGALRPSEAGVPTTMNLGSVTLNSGAFFKLTLNSNTPLADQLLVSSGTDLGLGVAQLNVQDSGATPLAPGTAFTIIDNSGPMNGFFSGLPDGASFVAGANTFEIDYNAGAGLNDVQITVVPEPSSALLLTAALALGGARRLRSRRR